MRIYVHIHAYNIHAYMRSYIVYVCRYTSRTIDGAHDVFRKRAGRRRGTTRVFNSFVSCPR